MKAVKPKKNLGQHFLTDLNIAKRIADTVEDVYKRQVCTVSQFLCLVYKLLFLFEIGRVGICLLYTSLSRVWRM